MPTSYINTGVLGQVVGGSLGTSGLTTGQQYQQLASDIKRKKRTLSAPSKAELDAARQRREERRAQSLIDMQLTTPVDTADVKVPSIKVDATASPEVQAQQQAANLAPVGITQTPAAAPPPAPPAAVIHPGRDLTPEAQAFGQAYYNLSQRVSSKVGTGRVKGASSSITSQYSELAKLAQATGNEAYIKAVQGIGGINYAQSSISAQNIARAAGNLQSGLTSLRDTIDFEYLMKQSLAPTPTSAVSVKTPLSKVVKIGRRG